MIRRLLFLLLCGPLWLPSAQAQGCGDDGVWVQVLGSGGPDLVTGRAGSSYLLWLDGKARAVVDMGPGGALHFYQAGASMADVDVLLFSHLHADHAGDLPALIKASAAQGRTQPLPIYGPEGNKYMPSTVTFVRALFDAKRGVFRDLGNYVSPLGNETYKLQPHDATTHPPAVRLKPRQTARTEPVFENSRLKAQATPVQHGYVPALAWRVELGGKRIVFTGDMTGERPELEALAKHADLLVAHHAIPEGAGEASRRAYMPPSVIGRIAYRSEVKQVLLSHRLTATLGREKESIDAIKTKYAGLVGFANDMDCIAP